MSKAIGSADLTKGDFEAIGIGKGLQGKRLTMYVQYMMLRGFVYDTAYAFEWAETFALGFEYNASDETGKKLLDGLYNQ